MMFSAHSFIFSVFDYKVLDVLSVKSPFKKLFHVNLSRIITIHLKQRTIDRLNTKFNHF